MGRRHTTGGVTWEIDSTGHHWTGPDGWIVSDNPTLTGTLPGGWWYLTRQGHAPRPVGRAAILALRIATKAINGEPEIPAGTMDPDAARWVRDHVLTRPIRESLVRGRCACQYGICGACGKGRHDRCLTWRTDGRQLVMKSLPETFVTNKRSMVAAGSAVVWRAGTPCSYQCPCPDCRPAKRKILPAVPAPGNPPAAVRVRPQQATLFDLADWGL